jgi:hypothetical protein
MTPDHFLGALAFLFTAVTATWLVLHWPSSDENTTFAPPQTNLSENSVPPRHLNFLPSTIGDRNINNDFLHAPWLPISPLGSQQAPLIMIP